MEKRTTWRSEQLRLSMKEQIRLRQASAKMSVAFNHNERFVMNDTASIAWLGLDAHSKNYVLGLLDDQGRERKWWRFPTQPQQLVDC